MRWALCSLPGLLRSGLTSTRLTAEPASCACVHLPTESSRGIEVLLHLPSHFSPLPGLSFVVTAAFSLTLCCHGWHGACGLVSSMSCALPCPASLCCSHLPDSGNTVLYCRPSVLVPLPSTLSLSSPSQTQKGKKNCENGMLTDKPTQLSEASMSVFWMFLFTS